MVKKHSLRAVPHSLNRETPYLISVRTAIKKTIALASSDLVELIVLALSTVQTSKLDRSRRYQR